MQFDSDLIQCAIAEVESTGVETSVDIDFLRRPPIIWPGLRPGSKAPWPGTSRFRP